MLTICSQEIKRKKQIEKIEEIGQYTYKKNDLIGQGYSSKVYSGINKNNQEQVAIKVINTEILAEKIHVTLLQSELQILQILKGCTNVVRVQNQTYIISQYCQTDLSKKLVPILPQQTIQKYINQLIQGYCQLFQKQIVHRDLKPANLLITTNQNDINASTLKIADFGFAIKLAQVRLQTKFNIGSPLYMSPQVLKKNQYSYKSDIWSIGVIVYEMLTGDTPWKADTEDKLYEKLEQLKVEQLISKNNFQEHFNDLLLKTLQFDKKKRISPQQLFSLQSWNKFTKQEIKPIPQIINPPQLLQSQKVQVDHSLKVRKTQKFYKSSSDKSPAYSRTNNDNNDSTECQVIINIKPVTKNKKSNSNTIEQNNVHLNVELVGDENKEGTTVSTAKTNQSNTMIVNQDTPTQLPKLDKTETKTITKNLIYYIHSCRLLFKVIVRINEVITNCFNQSVITRLLDIKQQLFQQHCKVIITYMNKVKNFINNNFLNLPNHHHEQYTKGNEYKKIKKICGQYIDKYSKSDQLKYLWVQRQQPNLKNCLNLTAEAIKIIWPELCQKNYNEIILLEFLIFSYEVLDALDKGSYNYISDKDKIQDYVDSIPNPPSFNRFKLSIGDAKRIVQKAGN